MLRAALLVGLMIAGPGLAQDGGPRIDLSLPGAAADVPCPDRPDDPAWFDEVPVMQAWRVVLIRHIYKLRAYERIIEAEECGCALRYPAWDATEEEFERLSNEMSEAELRAARATFARGHDRLRRDVLAICKSGA